MPPTSSPSLMRRRPAATMTWRRAVVKQPAGSAVGGSGIWHHCGGRGRQRRSRNGRGAPRRHAAGAGVTVRGQRRVGRCMARPDEAWRLFIGGHVCTAPRVLAGRRRRGGACKDDDEGSWEMREDRDGKLYTMTVLVRRNRVRSYALNNIQIFTRSPNYINQETLRLIFTSINQGTLRLIFLFLPLIPQRNKSSSRILRTRPCGTFRSLAEFRPPVVIATGTFGVG